MRHILLHGHIFKNAGTTLDWSLQQNFEGGFLDHRQDKLMRQNGPAHLEQLVKEDASLCALSSHHMTRDLPQIDAVKFIPINLLRHPLARIRSVYDFERKQDSETPGAKMAKQKNFRDYVAWRMQPDVARTIRNYQTLYLAGRHQPTDNSKIAGHYFFKALNAVKTAACIGIVERYDESMVVMEQTLRQYFPQIDLSYLMQNASNTRAADQTEAEHIAGVLGELGDLQKLVIDENSFDLALYQLGAAALDEKIAGIDAFEPKLADFRWRCTQR